MKPDLRQNEIMPESLVHAIENAFGPGLLDEALAEPSNQTLEQQVLALTDPQTLSLLDEALRVEAPDRLNEKILDKTLEQTLEQALTAAAPDGRRGGTLDAPPVLARIRPATTWRYAAAAAITLAAGVGLWFANTPVSPTNSSSDNLANRDNTTAGDTERLDEITFEQETALFTEATDRFETETRALSETLDTRIDRDTIWSDMDAYEQFLSDIESDLG